MNAIGELLRVEDIRLDLEVTNKVQLLGEVAALLAGEPEDTRATGLDGRRSRIRHSARTHESLHDCDGCAGANQIRHTLRRTRRQAGIGLSRSHRSAQGERSASATARHRCRHVQRPRASRQTEGDHQSERAAGDHRGVAGSAGCVGHGRGLTPIAAARGAGLPAIRGRCERQCVCESTQRRVRR